MGEFCCSFQLQKLINLLFYQLQVLDSNSTPNCVIMDKSDKFPIL